MSKINAASAPSSSHRLKFIRGAIALGVALSFSATAHGMEDIAPVDFELIDKLMAADQVNAVSDSLLTDPDSEPASDTNTHGWNGPLEDEPHLPKNTGANFYVDTPPRAYASFGEDVKAIKWEFAAVAGYYTAINAPKLLKDPRWPTTQTEGWFGRSTRNLGVDKLAHAYSAYIISELLYGRIKRKVGDAPGIELTAAALASGIMLWSEAFDSIEPTSGWSWEDVTFNTLGAGFSVVRNSVPGLEDKLDFRLLVQPNEDIYTVKGKEHFQQQRYLFAMKLAGFKAFERTPLRYVELHLGYRADDFLNEDRAAGISPKRHVFAGVGVNLKELLFKNARTRKGRAVGEVLTYFQPPFTSMHRDIIER
ncbi:MAG: hypothetical protein RLZZ61_1609 [Pseudomonadota bacterium]|jgi:hypothetical protein